MRLEGHHDESVEKFVDIPLYVESGWKSGEVEFELCSRFEGGMG